MTDLNNLYLGQGNTPLIRLQNLEQNLQWQAELWAKCEYQNPTGSFKDRGSAAEIAQALYLKKKGVVCASTGNMAASLSAFAAKVGLPCTVVIPKNTPDGKMIQARIAGAKLIEIEGNYDSCVNIASDIARQENYLLCGDYETRRSGQATIGEELAKSTLQIDGFVCPVGNGTVGCAISEGFAASKKYPAFIGVQGKGADPLTKTFQENKKTFSPLSNPKTIASAMNVGNPLDGKITLEWVYKTKGIMLSVTDSEILDGQKLLANLEGLYVEPAAAATVAALKKLKDKDQTLVLILTGSGLKSSHTSLSFVAE